MIFRILVSTISEILAIETWVLWIKKRKNLCMEQNFHSWFSGLLLFSCSVISLQPHGLQHARLPCPFISQSLLKLMSIESVMLSNHLILCHPLLLLPSIFPSIRVFSNESTLPSGGQSTGALASASVFPMNIYGWFPLDWLDSLESKGLSRVFPSITIWKHQFFGAQPSLKSNSHIHMWLLEKS